MMQVVVFSAFAGGPPPAMKISNAADIVERINVTVGSPGSCSCERPSCPNVALDVGQTLGFGPDSGCGYYAIGGGLVARDGHLCHTWRADFKSCNVYAGSTDGDCARLTATPTCTMSGTTATINATIDRKCDTFPWADCNATSVCCGANECALVDPKSPQMTCQPKK